MATTPDQAPLIVDAVFAEQPPEADKDLYLGDLALHFREFNEDLEIVQNIGEDFPCVKRKDGTTAPIDIAQYRNLAWWGRYWPLRRGIGTRLFDTESADEEIVFVAPAAARSYLRNGMVSFLTSRIRSLRGISEMPDELEPVSLTLPNHHFLRGHSPTVSTTGFTVKVSAATPGVRVHVSPTFRRSFRFFASPTSPAVGTLPGGIYEFAVDGGPYSTQTIDKGTFDIPYTTTTPVLAL